MSKLYAHWITEIIEKIIFMPVMEFCLIMKVLLEEKHSLQKIVAGLCNIVTQQEKLYLGNLYAKRDWGHAKIMSSNVENSGAKNLMITK